MLAIALSGGACHSIGPRQLPVDRFDYNSAIARSANEQMLLNLVRLRFGEVPVFLAVNSVLTQYVWTGEAGIAGSGGESLGFPAWTMGGSGNVRYIERPTVTYTPLTGQEFAAQLISPVRADVVFSLVSSGWPPDQLLVMTLQRVNDVENLGFAPLEARREQTREFSRMIELLIDLARRDAVELVRTPMPESDEAYLEFARAPDPDTEAHIREFKDLIGADPGRSRFRVTRRIVGRGPDEITIRTHSLLELMGLLAVGVEAPPGDLGAGGAARAAGTGDPAAPLVVRCQRKPPDDAFVAVQYSGYWYWMPRSDEGSKRAFGLITYLFQMQASQSQGAGPLLTVPVG